MIIDFPLSSWTVGFSNRFWFNILIALKILIFSFLLLVSDSLVFIVFSLFSLTSFWIWCYNLFLSISVITEFQCFCILMFFTSELFIVLKKFICHCCRCYLNFSSVWCNLRFFLLWWLLTSECHCTCHNFLCNLSTLFYAVFLTSLLVVTYWLLIYRFI